MAAELSAQSLLFGLAALASCSLTVIGDGRAQAGPPGMPPPAVAVAEIRPGRVPLTYEYAARVSASREVEVRAQAGGILLTRNFIEGAEVRAGDILFQIDSAPYQAQLAIAEAQLQQAEAQFSQASREA